MRRGKTRTLDGMSAWLNANWHHIIGLGGTGLIVGLYIYARRHPEGAAMSFWRRIKWTVAGGIAVMMIFILSSALVTVVAPELELIPLFLAHGYWMQIPVFIATWLAAPHLQKRFPVSPFDRH
jgi:hypothetical protein